MRKNYYEILEIDKNASKEIIDKAYKTLAKKYHPDLQDNEMQKIYEEKMKEINEAYGVLSDTNKKIAYDEQLKSTEISDERYQKMIQENKILKRQLEDIKRYENNNVNQYADDSTIMRMNKVLNQEINKARQQAYQDAYIQDLKDRGYRIKYKHDLKYYFKLIVVLAITVLICFLLYQIPAIKNFCINVYEENIIVKFIVDVIRNTLTTAF